MALNFGGVTQGGFFMNALNKKVAIWLLVGMGLAAQPMLASAAPELSIQSERAAHPRIVEAINNMQNAFPGMEGAPDISGGNKAPAMADPRRAIHSLKK